MLKIFTFIFLVATLLILAMCVPNPPKEEKHCLKEHNLTEEELPKLFDEFKKGKAVDRKLKCFVKCLFDVRGIIYDNGKIDMKQFLGKDESKPEDQPAIKIGNDCKAKYDSEEDECEYIFQIMACLTENTTAQLEKHKST